MTQIENSIQLKKHIMDLKYRAFEYEEEIGHDLKEISYQLHPSGILHRWLNDLKGDSIIKQDLKTVGRNAVLNLAVNTIFGRGRKLSGDVLFLIAKGIMSFIIRKK